MENKHKRIFLRVSQGGYMVNLDKIEMIDGKVIIPIWRGADNITLPKEIVNKIKGLINN